MKVKLKTREPAQQKEPIVKDQPARQFLPQRETFIGKFVRIAIEDIRGKLYGAGYQRPKEWEDYERFCKLCRGER